MSPLHEGGGKLPGKTKYAGRRRAMTRKSGFSVHANTTGGEFRRRAEKTYSVRRGESVVITFRIAGHSKDDLVGYGTWFCVSDGVRAAVAGGPDKKTLTEYVDDSWFVRVADVGEQGRE